MSIFLMGVYNPATKLWCTVTKCGSGFDDKTLDRLQKQDMVKISKVKKFRKKSVLVRFGGFGFS